MGTCGLPSINFFFGEDWSQCAISLFPTLHDLSSARDFFFSLFFCFFKREVSNLLWGDREVIQRIPVCRLWDRNPAVRSTAWQYPQDLQKESQCSLTDLVLGLLLVPPRKPPSLPLMGASHYPQDSCTLVLFLSCVLWLSFIIVRSSLN